MRVAGQERDQAVKVPGGHAAGGRRTLAALGERGGVALGAKTAGDLEEQLGDLPREAGVPARRRSASHWMVAVLGGSHRRGRFRLQSAVNVVAIMGGDDIDLRDAELDGGRVTLNIVSIMGGHNIYVPDTVEVEVNGFSLMGGDSEYGARREPLPGAPVVQIR